MSFVWKRGYHSSGDAEVFGQYFETLRQQHPEVTAETLVEAARAKSCPIHECFEWNNKVAGHAHRLTQARHMMAAIAVIEDTLEGPTAPVRYLIAVPPQATETAPAMKVYMPLQEAMADPLRRQDVLQRALLELRAFQVKYRQLTELAGVFEAIEQAAREALAIAP